MAAYATGKDLCLYYDRRRVAQLVTDDGRPPPESTVDSHPVVAAMLRAASDEAAAACGVGKKYTPLDLATLAGGTDAGSSLLKQIVCHIAFGLLLARRGLAADEFGKLAPMWKWAQGYLDLLRNCDRVLGGVEGVLDAGLPATASMARREGFDRPPSMVQESARIFGSGVITDRGKWPNW